MHQCSGSLGTLDIVVLTYAITTSINPSWILLYQRRLVFVSGKNREFTEYKLNLRRQQHFSTYLYSTVIELKTRR